MGHTCISDGGEKKHLRNFGRETSRKAVIWKTMVMGGGGLVQDHIQ